MWRSPLKVFFLVRQISSCPCPHVNTQKRRMKTSTCIGESENEHHENRCLSKVSSVGKEQWGAPHLEMRNNIRQSEYTHVTMNVKLDRVFALLGNLQRLRIVHLLAQTGMRFCVCELVEILGLPQPTISRLLVPLRAYGIVEVSRDRQWVYYKLAPKFQKWLANIFAEAPLSDSELSRDLKRAVGYCKERDRQGNRATCGSRHTPKTIPRKGKAKL